MRVQRWARGRAPAVDAVLAAATALGAVVLLVVSGEEDRRAADALAAALLLLAAAPLTVRRRWPAAALAVTTLCTVVYLQIGYPGGPTTVPVLVALYSAAAWGRRIPALLVVGFFVGVGSVQRLLVQRDDVTTVAFQGLLYVFAWLVGELVCSRRALRTEIEARAQQAAEEREREAQRRVQDERMRFARELHDVMAHTVSTMTVQAGAAADLLEDRPDEARASLQTIRRAGREAMAELRATVSLFRSGDDGAPRPPAPALGDLDALVERVAGNGLSISRETTGDPPAVPAAVELTGYRIVQEALTNVVRHAGARTAVISVRYEPDTLTIEVADDGRGASGRVQGFGLLGMRERAEALGGTLEAGPREGGGFRVLACLPTGHGGR